MMTTKKNKTILNLIFVLSMALALLIKHHMKIKMGVLFYDMAIAGSIGIWVLSIHTTKEKIRFYLVYAVHMITPYLILFLLK